MLKKNDISFKIIDARAENLNIKKMLAKIKALEPRFIGFTTNIALAYSATYFSIYIKKNFSNINIIFGGPWATAEYEYILKKKIADFVLLGEAEYSLVQLIKHSANREILKNLPGYVFIQDSQIYNTGNYPFIEKLDELPYPCWEEFPKKGYYKSSRYRKIYPLITSRGCPYDCLNCTKIIHGHKLRYRSIENVLGEIDYLHSIGCEEIIIEDDMYNYDLERLKELLKRIIKRNYNMKFQLSNGIRADKVDYELALLLYNSGTYKAALGIESGSQKVVDFLNKKLDLKKVPLAVYYLKKAHIKVSGYFILGLPIETYSSLIYTIYFADKLNLDIMLYLNFLAFPGSKIRNYLLQKVDIDEQKSKISPISNYIYTPLYYKSEKLNDEIMRKVKRYYLIRFYLNPRRFFKFINNFTFYELVFQSMIILKTFLSQIFLPDSAKNKKGA